MGALRGRPAAALARLTAALPGRLVRRFVAISGYDRALALAAQAFVALVPAAMLAIASLPGRDAAGNWLVDRLGLTGPTAETVASLAVVPDPGVSGLAGGIAVVVVTGIGFTRTLQRLYVAAWGLEPLGWRGFLSGLLGVLALVTAIAASVALEPDGPAGPLVQAGLAILLWLPVQRLLLGHRVTLRRLLPGAIVVGVGQTLVGLFSGPFLRVAMDAQADRFGLLGVVFVLVSWLLVLAYLLVGAAVFSAELAGAPLPGTTHPPDVREDGGAPARVDAPDETDGRADGGT